MNNHYSYTKENFQEHEWNAFKSYVRTHFVNALNSKYKLAIKCYSDSVIEFNELTPDIENKLMSIVDLAREEQLTPQERYDKANTTQIKMKLNNTTDSDILDKLSKVDNKQAYIKALIRKDLE